MNPNQNDNFFYEDEEDQFDPQDLTSDDTQQGSQGMSQSGMGSQEVSSMSVLLHERPRANFYFPKKSKTTQTSKTGIKPAEETANDNITAGKYSVTHDDLVDPDE